MKNYKHIFELIIILFFPVFSVYAGDRISNLVIKDYQAFAEIKSEDYTKQFKITATNIVSKLLFESFMRDLKRNSLEKIGVDLTSHNEMKRIGIDVNTSSAIVFTDIFFTQSFYAALKIKNIDSFTQFLKKRAFSESHGKQVDIEKENDEGFTYIIIKISETIHYVLYQIDGYVIVSKNYGLVKKAALDIKNKNTIRLEPFYLDRADTFKSDFIVVYIKPYVFSQAMNMLLLLTGRAQKILYDYAFLNAFTNHAFGFQIEDKFIGLNIHSTLNKEDKFAKLFLKIPTTSGYGLHIVEYLPENPYIFIHINSHPKDLIDLFAAGFPDVKNSFENFLKRIKKIFDFDFNAYFLSACGNSFGLALYSFDPTILLLQHEAVSKSNILVYFEVKNPGLMNLFLITMSRSIKKINPKATMSYSFIRGLQFYEVKSDITFYVGIFVNYLIIGTKKEQISKLLYNLIIRSRTNFINSLQAPNFSKPLLDRFTFNVFVNLQKVFENSILPQLAIEQGVKLHGLKNLFLNVNIRDNAVHSVLNLYFK